MRSLSNSSLKNSAIISLSDLNKIKSSINIFDKNYNQISPRKNERYDETFLTKSIKLKNRIINYDIKNNNNLNRLNKIDYEKEKEKNKKEIIKKAQKEMEENYDEVKYYN